MKRLDRKRKSVTKSVPIKLDDLLPPDNVSGGKSKNVFGIVSKEGKERKSGQ